MQRLEGIYWFQRQLEGYSIFEVVGRRRVMISNQDKPLPEKINVDLRLRLQNIIDEIMAEPVPGDPVPFELPKLPDDPVELALMDPVFRAQMRAAAHKHVGTEENGSEKETA